MPEPKTKKPDVEFSPPWCACLEETLEGWHGNWPILYEFDGEFFDEPFHWCPACYDEDGDVSMLSGPCKKGHEPPSQD